MVVSPSDVLYLALGGRQLLVDLLYLPFTPKSGQAE